MPAVENRLDDVGSEKGERQDTAYVALMNAVALGKISNRCRSAVAKLGRFILVCNPERPKFRS